jgi:pimeloyl-ACP methyl ester carboxylesterase
VRFAIPGLLLLAVVTLAVAVAARAAFSEMKADFRQRPAQIVRPTMGGLAGAVEVVLPTPAAEIHGWYVAPRNGALVVLAHGTGANRTQLSGEAEALIAGGYGVVAIDFPGYGASTGKPRWNEGERAALRAALDFAVGHGVDPHRIGVFAFSMGIMIAIQVAADDPRISALVLAGAFEDPDGPIASDFHKWGPLTQRPAIWAAHLSGMRVDGKRPLDLVAKLAPRPLLLIAGSDDQSVPLARTRALMAAAAEPKTLWTIEGAHHGDYRRVLGAEYDRRLVAFYDRALSGRAATW